MSAKKIAPMLREDKAFIASVWREASRVRRLINMNGHRLDTVDDLALLFNVLAPHMMKGRPSRSSRGGRGAPSSRKGTP